MQDPTDDEDVNAEDATSVSALDPSLTDATRVSRSTRQESTDTVTPLVLHQMMPPLEEK